MPQDVDLIEDVIGYLEARLATFNDGVPYLTSRQDELQKIIAHFKAMVLYKVDFEEEGGEDDAAINIYSDPEMTNKVGETLTTSDGGKATTNLVNGIYYFKVTKASFEDYTGEFTVDGEDITVEFELEASD